MKSLWGGLLLWGLGLPLTAQAQVTPEVQQAVVVLSDHWQAVDGTLQRLERQANGPWQRVGSPIPIVVGKKGMGWGRGLFQLNDPQADYRREGDKRAPAGIFSLGSVFGLATQTQAQQWLTLRMPYIHLNPTVRCIGDAQSRYYNEIHDIRHIEQDWLNDNNNENMRRDAIRDEGAYRWGVFVQHNTTNSFQARDKVSGSCIFLHIWKGDGSGTSGCTAMTKTNLLDVINWLEADKHPVLIQLPRPVYASYQKHWQLPAPALKP